MVDQLPNLGREAEMLEAMGMTSIDDLFTDIPEHVRSFKSLPYFLEWNLCTNIVYESEIELPGPNNTTYTRFTAMGYKE